jgi:hypothetical protein
MPHPALRAHSISARNKIVAARAPSDAPAGFVDEVYGGGECIGLLRFDVGRPDDLAPLLGFLGHELPEIGGRH